MNLLTTIGFLSLLGSVGCATHGTSDPDPDLMEEQGACATLDVTSCRIDGRCQQSFVESGHQQFPAPLKCLLVEAPAASSAACTALTKDECRSRNDCMPIYFQDLGPTDSPVGEPYYKHCEPELSPDN